jgi:hypothetical protein
MRRGGLPPAEAPQLALSAGCAKRRKEVTLFLEKDQIGAGGSALRLGWRSHTILERYARG